MSVTALPASVRRAEPAPDPPSELEALRARVAALEERMVGVDIAVGDFRAAFAKTPARTGPGVRFQRPRLGRLLYILAHPLHAARLTRTFLLRTAVTSRRAYWTGGRWRRRVSAKAYAGAVGRKVRALASGPQHAFYDAAPFSPLAIGRRPRVLHVIANVAVGGSTQLMVDLMTHLGHRYEMEVLTSAVPPGGLHRHMPIHLAPQPGSTAADIRRTFHRFRPDLVHVHYWGDVDQDWYALAFEAAEELGVPVIENINTPVAPHRSPAVKAYVYVSDYVRREFGEGGPDELVIHPGSDFSRFVQPDERDPDAGRSIGMVYRLERDKLDEDSVLPLIEVVRRRPATRAFVIGEGSLFLPFLTRVKQAGLAENFIFPGYIPYADLPSWYARFGVFMAPVWKESFGQVTPFAMSMGLAVTGANVGALPEILGGEERLGRTPEEIADRTVELLDDAELRARVGAANRDRAHAHYAVSGMIGAYAALYGRLAPVEDLMPDFPPAELFLA